MDADRNLRFGLAALDRGAINAAQLAELARDWRSSPGRSIADLITERGWLSAIDRATIENSLDTHQDTSSNGHQPAPRPGDGNSTAEGHSTVVAEPRDGWRVPSGTPTIKSPEMDLGAASRNPLDFGTRYTNVSFHAEGGIGRVWSARDRILDRDVALKEIKPKYDGDSRIERRFLEEARITARLQHPNIVPTHDLAAGLERPPFYSMRFVDGSTLKEAVLDFHRGKPTPRIDTPEFRRLLDAFLGICNAIAYAHSQGVLHRDLKGQNIVLGPFGEVFVLDWGLAREIGSAEDPLVHPTAEVEALPSEFTRTMDGYPIGTLQYIPPEQAEGRREAIGPHSDVFGLGAILYLILTGRPPYEGGDSGEILRKALARDLKTPSSLNANVPAALESICLKAMDATPRERYESANALADDVRNWMADEPVTAHAEGPEVRLARWARKNQPILAGAAALLLTASVAFAIGFWRVRAESDKVAAERGRLAKANGILDANLKDSLGLIGGVLEILVTDLPQVRDPAIDAVRAKASTTTAEFVAALQDRNPGTPELRVSMSNLLRESAKLDELTGRLPESEARYRRAAGLLDPATFGPTITFVSRDLLAEYQIALADALLRQGKAKEANEAADSALKTARASRRLFPTKSDAIRTEARALMIVADTALMQGKAEAAERLEREAIGLFDGLARAKDVGAFDALSRMIARLSQGMSLRELQRLDEAAKALSDSRDAADAMIEAKDNVLDAQNQKAMCQLELARLLAPKAPPADTLKALDVAIVEIARIAEDRPQVMGFRIELAYALAIRGEAPGCPNPDKDFARAVALCDQIMKECPSGAPTRAFRARAKAGLAKIATAKPDVELARRLVKEATEDLDVLTSLNPGDPEGRAAAQAVRQAAEAIK